MQDQFPVVPASSNLPLIIDGIEIRQDAQGRYCLNDLHRASGGEARHKPSEWLRNKQTTELINELSKAGIPAIQSKQQLGTFASKDLVYDYAMWISAAFKVKVIRTFDAVVTGQYQPAPVDPIQLLNDPAVLKNLLLANIQQNEEQKLQIGQRDKIIADLSPKAMIAERLVMSDEAVNLTTAAKLFRLPPHKFNKALERIKWIYKRPGSKHWLGHQPKVIAGYIDHKEHVYTKESGETGTNPQVVITQKGLAKLALLLGKEPDVNALDSLVADHYADTDSSQFMGVAA